MDSGGQSATSYKKYLAKRVSSLLVPFVLFVGVTYLYWLAIESRFREFDIGPMWFLLALFAAEIITETVKRFFESASNRLLLLLTITLYLIFSTILTSSPSIELSWLRRISYATSFYLLGLIMSDFVSIYSCNAKHISVGCLVIVFITSIVLVVLDYITGTITLETITLKTLFYFSKGFVCSVFMYMLCLKISDNVPDIVAWMGKYSIIIMCTHEQIKRVVIQFVSSLCNQSADTIRNNIMYGIVIAMIVILINIPIAVIIIKVAEKMKKTKLSFVFDFIR